MGVDLRWSCNPLAFATDITVSPEAAAEIADCETVGRISRERGYPLPDLSSIVRKILYRELLRVHPGAIAQMAHRDFSTIYAFMPEHVHLPVQDGQEKFWPELPPDIIPCLATLGKLFILYMWSNDKDDRALVGFCPIGHGCSHHFLIARWSSGHPPPSVDDMRAALQPKHRKMWAATLARVKAWFAFTPAASKTQAA